VNDLRVAVVGGGQAGLAMGYALMRRGLRPRDDFLILDAGAQAGSTWAARWNSLRLFTPARHSALPGLPFPADPDAYPGKDDVARYLADYAHRFDLPVRSGVRVQRVAQAADGFVLSTADGPIRARQVVAATGPFQVPAVPTVAGRLPAAITQVHSAAYRCPAQLPPGPVLVVGAGNSGVQIAAELAAGHDVILAVGTRLPTLPQRVAGRDIFTWLTRTRIMDITVDSALGRRLSRRDVLVGTRLRDLPAAGVSVLGRVTTVDDDGVVVLGGGRRVCPAVAVWATGYRPDYTWLPQEVVAPTGWPLHRRGVTPLPGVAVLGLSWQHTRGSALLGWVGRDADRLARQLVP
jgi:putative flavoprotein involved in K+ transport